ncbi:hypothetical protein J421_3801 [Gemmatirosa kalamazoonensis]|uniref:Uncharacterized protein n=1 Tax=Gemmatirosa kalamazoonensis TaxID=861299 RepID=W0RPD2_9BACT|nr:hypothetical protein [Gemmatirosa kalamazoonensis]AHG91338.1 hypothetical protein J421_3801 [Gemmatirosa kalamazoonensis]
MSATDSAHHLLALPTETAGSEPPRVRLVDVRARLGPSVRYRVEVHLESPEGRPVVASHEDASSATGDVRIAAEAAVKALRAAMPAAPPFYVAGAKTVRAFDQTVTLVLIGITGEPGPARLLGAACNEENLARAAVVAVLNATNRVRNLRSGS